MASSARKKGLSHAQIMAMGFILVIMSGTFLLMLPFASKTGQVTHFMDALFTSVSASCVTGLVVMDTFTHWTLFGQIVILCMIQVGGLGVITISAIVYSVFGQRIGLNMRNMIQESTYAFQLGGIVKSLQRIFRRTFIIEGIGAILLSIRFIPMMGVGKGIWYGVFHSISAFCNAGFDLFGRFEQYSSLMRVYVVEKGLRFKKYSLHSKVVLIMLAVLTGVGTLLFIVFEHNNLFEGMSPGQMIMSALFAAVTPRTAGFNTTDLATMSQAGKFLTCLYMFIGGNSGSTAGGIKTTTVVVMGAYILSNLTRSTGVHIMKRRIGDENIKMASMVFGLNITLIVTALIIISSLQTLPMDNLLLEVFSAMGTVGLSAGLTRSLLPASRIVIMLLMFAGRVGTVTFAVSFRGNRRQPYIKYPEEKINVG